MVALAAFRMMENRFQVDGVFEDDALLLLLAERARSPVADSRRCFSLVNGDELDVDRLVDSAAWEL